jgi:hypothetical protein
MANEHHLLAVIRTRILESGTHRQHWGELRREVFPAQLAWLSLKAWCAENGIDCELVFGQSSRNAEVQFCKRSKAASAPVPAGEVTCEVRAAPTPA